MSHILENINPDKRYTPMEVLEEEITHLMVRMSDFANLSENDAHKRIIDDWRKELVIIRNALVKLQS